MKRRNRILSLLFALALVFSITIIPVAAADYANSQDPLMAAVMAADDYEVRYTEDGSAMIITATVSSENVPAMEATVWSTNPKEQTGTATWNDNSEVYFQCRNGWGTVCRLVYTNEDESVDLEIEQDFVINGEPVNIVEYASPGESKVTIIRSNSSTNLTCRIDTILSPDGGLSVDWSFYGEQY